MQSRNDLSKKLRAALQMLCLLLCVALTVSLLSSCKKTDSGEASSDASSGYAESDSNDPASDEVGDGEMEDTEDPSLEGDDIPIIEDGDATDDPGDVSGSEDEDFVIDPVVLNVYNSRAPLNDNWMGMNATVYHAFGFIKDDSTGRVYTDKMMDIELDRLEGMGFKTCRTNFFLSWIWDSNQFNFNSKRMGYFADYCKALDKRDMTVMLNHAWYMTMLENDYKTGYYGYINGNGADMFGESSAFADCVATEFKLKGNQSLYDAGIMMGGGANVGRYETVRKNTTITEYYDRLAVSALRYGYVTARMIQQAKALGVKNLDYMVYFTEPSIAHESQYSPSGYDPKGPEADEYLFICSTMRNVMEKTGMTKGVKHVGPNQGSIETGDGLLKYVLEKNPDLFDILTTHFYPTSDDITGDTYYDNCYNVISSYRDTMEDAGVWGKKEFWQDEYFASINNYSRVKENRFAGPQTIVGAICSQQMGVDNLLMWMAFDQLWTDNRDTGGEFQDGVHMTGTAPSLFVSATPYHNYYSVGLFTRYNNSKGGKAIATSSGDYEEYPGLYIGATELPDGNYTFTVVSVNSVDTTFKIKFDKALGKDLHRHVEDTVNRVPKASAIIAEADCSFKAVKTSLTDTIAPFAVHVYTTCKY